MNPKIDDILERMKSLGLELEKELESTRQNFRYELVNRKVHFERDILNQQKKLRASLLKPRLDSLFYRNRRTHRTALVSDQACRTPARSAFALQTIQ